MSTPPDEMPIEATAPAPDPDRAKRRAKGLKYVAALDGLRALAALGVVIIHTESAAQSSIWTYVITGTITGPLFMLFFAISGFVLYRGWARRHLAMADRGRRQVRRGAKTADGGADGRSGKYLVRRLLRIYPLYWVVATAAVFATGGAGSHGVVEYVQLYLLSPYPHPQTLVDLGLGIVVWTLIIDVVFYVYVLLHGMVMNQVVRRTARRVSPFRLESAVLIAIMVAILVGALFVPAPLSALVCLPVGMWFAVIEAEQDRRGHQLRAVRAIASYWYVWVILFVTVAPLVDIVAARATSYGQFLSANMGIHVLLVFVGIMILMRILWGPPRSPLNQLLASPFMRRLGFLTYGTYLWHPVILILLERHVPDGGMAVYQLATVGGSLVLAAVTYVAIEKPLARVRLDMRKPESVVASPANP